MYRIVALSNDNFRLKIEMQYFFISFIDTSCEVWHLFTVSLYLVQSIYIYQSCVGVGDPNMKTEWNSYVAPMVHAYNSRGRNNRTFTFFWCLGVIPDYQLT